MKTTLYIVRHGQTEFNRDGIVSGQNNPKLTDLGRQQAEATQQLLRDITFDTVYSSDLQRAVQTAEIVSGQTVSAKHRLRQLRERSFGKLDGGPSQDLLDVYAAHKAVYGKLDYNAKWRFKNTPDMESDAELANRFMSGLQTVAENEAGKTVLVGSHGGVMRVMLIDLGYGTLNTLPPGAVNNAAYVKLEYENNIFSVIEVHGVDLSVQ